jgi:hypothetical protein
LLPNPKKIASQKHEGRKKKRNEENDFFSFFVCMLPSQFSFIVFFKGILCHPLFGGRKPVGLPVKPTGLLLKLTGFQNKIIFGFKIFEI